MGNKEINIDQLDDKEVQNRFTSYVREAMKNTRSTYYAKQSLREAREIMLSDIDMAMNVGSYDMFDTISSYSLEMIETISLWNALKDLSRQDIVVIKLRVLYGYSFREIGKALNMTESAARMRYCRAIKTLRKAMEK